MGTGIIDIPSLKFKLDLCVDVNYTINLLQSSSLFIFLKGEFTIEIDLEEAHEEGENKKMEKERI